jgi:DNA gyrase subunit A
MQLRRLAALERRKLEDEYKEKIELIKMLTALLQSPQMMRVEVARELREIRAKYADPRRTVSIEGPAGDIQAGDFLGPREDTWVTLTESGLLSRTYEDAAPKITTEAKDPPLAMLGSNTTHTLYLFTPDGLGATVPVKLLQQTEDPEQGLHFSTLTPFEQETPIAAAISIPPELETGYLISVTEQGEVKRLRLEDLPGLTANAFKFMDVEKGDRLIWLGYVEDDDEIVVVTLKGMAIRFSVNDVRPTGMGAGGMRAVKLQGKGDAVVGAAVVEDRANVWVCTDTGVAKSTPLSEYPTQGRAGQGVITMKLPSDAKGLAAATVGRPDDNIVVVTNKGKPKYMRVGLAPETRRNAKGDYIISLRVKEVVSRVVKLLPRLEASALPAVEAEAEEA